MIAERIKFKQHQIDTGDHASIKLQEGAKLPKKKMKQLLLSLKKGMKITHLELILTHFL